MSGLASSRGRSASRPKLLFVKSRRASFIELDQQLLAGSYEITEIYQPGKLCNPFSVLAKVRQADVIVGWWASWHTFVPFTLAWLLRKPSLLIVGGFDTAAEPEFGYGYQLGGIRKHLSRWIMRCARVLVTNSEYSRQEIERNVGIPASGVTRIYHGIPDTLAGCRSSAEPTIKRQMVLTVGIVDATNLTRKGLMPFVLAAAQLPDVEFMVAGKATPDAQVALQAAAGSNVRLTGWVPDAELDQLMSAASVYVQASKHEGFGVSLAEAMLHECVPVVTRAGALPEVVGDTGVITETSDPDAVASAIRHALELASDQRCGRAARARIMNEFSVDRRQRALLELLHKLFA